MKSFRMSTDYNDQIWKVCYLKEASLLLQILLRPELPVTSQYLKLFCSNETSKFNYNYNIQSKRFNR